jgi:hypothetical protein
MSHSAKFLQFVIRAIEFDRAHGSYRTRCDRFDLERRARVLADRIIQGRQ